MRIFLNIVAVLLTLVGVGWFLQGVNVLPGSTMSGQIEWAVYGGIAFAVGIGLLVYVNRRKGTSAKNEK
jgi:ABC-type multidrug transport system permease subunit